MKEQEINQQAFYERRCEYCVWFVDGPILKTERTGIEYGFDSALK
ncbi:hypothetical protein Pan153_11760 [Gimesia panareensis]|uniref:Uncharacterized protein n=1 Tax=Gimesia panareensis TaxID=2527978 RepID=A0A518FJQ3_9PLAN|nr:hypothetical protein Pan153_11760 [Gimesia panareensis]